MGKVRNTRGFTLVETLVAIALFVLGIAGFTFLFLKVSKNRSYILEMGNASASASRAMDDMVHNLRKARQSENGSYPIQSLGSFDLVAFLDDDHDGRTERVHYYLSNGDLKKGVTKASGNPPTYAAGDQTTKTLAHYIANTGAQPIFYYYNKDYPIDTVNNPLTNPAVYNVRLIQIHLWVNIKPLTAPDNINIQSFAELRNLNQE